MNPVAHSCTDHQKEYKCLHTAMSHDLLFNTKISPNWLLQKCCVLPLAVLHGGHLGRPTGIVGSRHKLSEATVTLGQKPFLTTSLPLLLSA